MFMDAMVIFWVVFSGLGEMSEEFQSRSWYGLSVGHS